MSTNVQIILIVLFFLILISIQYTLNKILVELREIKRTNLLNIKKNLGIRKLKDDKMMEEEK